MMLVGPRVAGVAAQRRRSRAIVGRGVEDCPVVNKAHYGVMNEKHKYVVIVN
jgi:hypothetical protein